MSDTLLAPSWQDWIVDNALAGVQAAQLIAELVDAGVPEALATSEVTAILASPGLRAARRLQRTVERREALLGLLRTLEQGHGRGIERVEGLSGDEFYARYVRHAQPVVLTDVARDWPARHKWSPAYLARVLGDAELQICEGRDQLERPDRDYERCVRTTTMAEYAAKVSAAGETNDLYMIANNHVAELPSFAPLLEDIRVDSRYLTPQRACSFWFGPAGTRTPLHHDSCNILFCQLRGRKRLRLLAPWSTRLADAAEGYYASESVEQAVMAGERGYEVVLEPGEALYLPGWWWHEVHALDLSVSLSFLNFRKPTTFDAYALSV